MHTAIVQELEQGILLKLFKPDVISRRLEIVQYAKSVFIRMVIILHNIVKRIMYPPSFIMFSKLFNIHLSILASENTKSDDVLFSDSGIEILVLCNFNISLEIIIPEIIGLKNIIIVRITADVPDNLSTQGMIKPIINAGLKLLQNVINILPWQTDKRPEFTMSDVILLPIGKPHISPIKNG